MKEAKKKQKQNSFVLEWEKINIGEVFPNQEIFADVVLRLSFRDCVSDSESEPATHSH